MKKEIDDAILGIEGERAVRVLLAVESGSRAWGFASPDSDYDVRFIYVHSRDWYVSVLEERDVIETMLPGALDVSGWDLRKALRLFARCNLALNEWLGSPITYVEIGHFRSQLAALVPKFFNPVAGMHHYRKMAHAALEGHFVDGQIGIKKCFYVLRPMLACRWIQHTRTQPPTEFARLVAAPWVIDEERRWIANLVERKARAAEADSIQLEPERATAMRAELSRYESDAMNLLVPERPLLDDLNSLLRRWTQAENRD